MSGEPMIEIEELHGKTVKVSLVRGMLQRFCHTLDVDTIGGQLFSLVDETNGTNLLLDFTETDNAFMEMNYAAGDLIHAFLGKLFALRKRVIKVSGRVALVVKPGSRFDEIIDLCCMRVIFEIYSTVEEALSRF